MRRTTMLYRAATMALSATLACSCAPVAAFATSDDASSQTSEISSADVSADPIESSSAAATDDAPAAVVMNHTEPLASDAEASQVTATPEDTLEIVRAAVPVSTQHEASIVFTQGGLNYHVNADESTVSLVGVSNAAAGELAIPAEVTFGNHAYKVTALSSDVESRGGGRTFTAILKMTRP